jgi:hypothetical protein
MANEDKKAKAGQSQKKPDIRPKQQEEGASKSKENSDSSSAKAENGEKAVESPPGYSRGEGQKPVSKAYKDNWNAIYGKKRR